MSAYTCCSRQSIQTMDHDKYYPGEEPRRITNRICLRCWTHWYGEGEIKKYTRKEWDALMDSAFNEDLREASR